MRLPCDLRNTPSDAAMEAAIEDWIDNAIDATDSCGSWPVLVNVRANHQWTDAAIRRVLKKYLDSGWQVQPGWTPDVRDGSVILCVIGRPGDKMPAVPFLGAPNL